MWAKPPITHMCGAPISTRGLRIRLSGVPSDFNYVNMADLNTKQRSDPRASAAQTAHEDARTRGLADDPTALIELFFFAYRDFTGDPDAVLAEYGLGRAHHRVLHFVRRNPGLRVADLLGILKITKQSLARVLKQLMDDGWLLQEMGADDRRERRLHLTPRGSELAMRLVKLQIDRIERALSMIEPALRPRLTDFLFAMISNEDRDEALRVIRATQSAPR
jgi:DNA-binding MarR family transcriptional regulator